MACMKQGAPGLERGRLVHPPAIGDVAEKGMSERRQVNPDLMGAAGVKRALDESRGAPEPLDDGPVRPRGPAAPLLVHDRHLVALAAVPSDRLADASALEAR